MRGVPFFDAVSVISEVESRPCNHARKPKNQAKNCTSRDRRRRPNNMCARFGRDSGGHPHMCAHTVCGREVNTYNIYYVSKPEAQKTNTNTALMKKRSCEWLQFLLSIAKVRSMPKYTFLFRIQNCVLLC